MVAVGSGFEDELVPGLQIVQVGEEGDGVLERARQAELLSDTELSEPDRPPLHD